MRCSSLIPSPIPSPIPSRVPEQVLEAPGQASKVLSAKRVDKENQVFYEFEFVTKASNYLRHGLASVTVSDGKFYTLLTGCNDRRWGKMQDKLQTVVTSFQLLYGPQVF